jgi:hypothetical protein
MYLDERGSARTEEIEMEIKAYHGTLTEFDEFDTRFSTDGLLHFGSRQQATARLHRIDDGASKWIILECEITLQNPISGLKDIDDWSDHKALAWSILETQDDEGLLEIARRYEDEPYSFLGDGPNKAMMEEIKALGYDGFIYGNIGEGSGQTSYAVFSEDQVQIVG